MDHNAWKPHVTVAAICQRNGKFLLIREMVHGKEVINQPAGHLDPGESLEQAVIRETQEETAYDFTPERLCGIYRGVPEGSDIQQTIIRFSFSGTIGKKHPQALDKGIIKTEWMSLEEIKKTQAMHRSPLVLQCVLDYLHKPSYPLQVFSRDFI